jgi:hypothetical protein
MRVLSVEEEPQPVEERDHAVEDTPGSPEISRIP